MDRNLPCSEKDYAASPLTRLDPHDASMLIMCSNAHFLLGQPGESHNQAGKPEFAGTIRELAEHLR